MNIAIVMRDFYKKKRATPALAESPFVERIYDVFKWGMILVIAGAVFHFVFNFQNPYELKTTDGCAYKIENPTGKVLLITRKYQREIAVTQ